MKQDITVTLGKKIKEERNKAGITQELLAALTKIDYKYIQRIEGKTPPNITVRTIEKIAKALKVKIRDLF
jgi:transcriptional regulator with XRE-family HTH domain